MVGPDKHFLRFERAMPGITKKTQETEAGGCSTRAQT